tara:strand:- start:8450 stop:9739 length:1290 start_codon:yes stop_codon:yes gene_type:complete
MEDKDGYIDSAGISGKEYAKRPHESQIPFVPEKEVFKMKDIPKFQKGLYSDYMKSLARKANQEIYTRFVNSADIDFIPVFVYYDKISKSLRVRVRKDWVEAQMAVKIDFIKWLKKKRKFKAARKWQAWTNPNFEGVYGKDYMLGAPHVKELKKQYIKEMTESGQVHEFMKGKFNKDTKKPQYSVVMRGVKEELREYKYDKNKKHLQINTYLWNAPIKGKDLLALEDDRNEDIIWGGSNFRSYLREGGISVKAYNEIMKGVLETVWYNFERIDVNALTDEGVGAFEDEYYGRFPNIVKIRDWFVNKGIYGAKQGHQKYNIEKFQSLKSNKARANFIDRATFIIANEIFIKNNNLEKVYKKSTSKSNRGNRILSQNAGMKTPISTARRYKKYTKGRSKRSSRAKNYADWRESNRELAAKLKRADTRRRRQS